MAYADRDYREKCLESLRGMLVPLLQTRSKLAPMAQVIRTVFDALDVECTKRETLEVSVQLLGQVLPLLQVSVENAEVLSVVCGHLLKYGNEWDSLKVMNLSWSHLQKITTTLMAVQIDRGAIIASSALCIEWG